MGMGQWGVPAARLAFKLSEFLTPYIKTRGLAFFFLSHKPLVTVLASGLFVVVLGCWQVMCRCCTFSTCPGILDEKSAVDPAGWARRRGALTSVLERGGGFGT